MQVPLELIFKDIPPTDWIEKLVQEKVRHLEQIHPDIISCHVTIREPHRRHRKGNLAEVGIEVRMSGGTLTVHQRQTDFREHVHFAVAIRDGFAAMTRKVNDWKEKRRGDVKTHEGALQGRVDSIDYARGFGQILATDHRLVYFHRNSVVDGAFDHLAEGDEVELVVQTDESDIGPQASTVRAIGALRFDPA